MAKIENILKLSTSYMKGNQHGFGTVAEDSLKWAGKPTGEGHDCASSQPQVESKL